MISVSPSTKTITTNIPTTTNVIFTINSLPEHSSNGVMTEPRDRRAGYAKGEGEGEGDAKGNRKGSGSGMSFIDLSSSGITEHADSISENSISSHFSSSTSHILKTMTTIDNTLQNSITPTTTPRGRSNILVIFHIIITVYMPALLPTITLSLSRS